LNDQRRAKGALGFLRLLAAGVVEAQAVVGDDVPARNLQGVLEQRLGVLPADGLAPRQESAGGQDGGGRDAPNEPACGAGATPLGGFRIDS
jgi:hypothetical protein